MSFAQDLPVQDATALIVKAYRGQSPTVADINKVAEAMNVSPTEAANRLRSLNEGISGQFGALARGLGVDADKAAEWIRTHRQSESLTALRHHAIGRNLQAWTPLIQAYRAAGGQ